MKKCLCLLALVLAASAFGYPSCGTGQISAGSLADCSVGEVDFTNWSFSAPGYTGEATVEISIPLPGTDNVTLMFSDPALGLINFSLAYTAIFGSLAWARITSEHPFPCPRISRRQSQAPRFAVASRHSQSLRWGWNGCEPSRTLQP